MCLHIIIYHYITMELEHLEMIKYRNWIILFLLLIFTVLYYYP